MTIIHTGRNTTEHDNTERKERVTVSLSAGALRFLRTLQRQENSPSLSASVENMIEKTRRARELADLDASVSAYYNSLSEAEMREESAWAEAGVAGLATFESETERTSPEVARANR